MTYHEIVLKIIASRAWRNGSLLELAEKALQGDLITRDDTDLTEEKWDKLIANTFSESKQT